jgi:hypothetical protein
VSKREVVKKVPPQQVEIAQRDHQKLEGDDAIPDREALEGGFSGPLEPRSHAVTISVVQEKR